MKSLKKIAVSVLAVCAAFALVIGGMSLNNRSVASAEESTATVVTSPFTAAIAEVKDSVVGVSNYQLVRYSNNFGGWGSYFGWGDFYGGRGNDQQSTQEVKAATGSGVVIADGYVLTNNHVVDGASTLKIAVQDENGELKEYSAVLVAKDENLDIAIVYSPDLKIKPVTLGDSDTLQVGDWAICIGNPLSDTFYGTVTAGIVSAINRSVSSSSYDRYGRRETITNTMIQTDAAINNGYSGGGMFSVSGELMGIPTMKYSGSAYSGATIDGIGLCIPINAAKPLIDDVMSGTIKTPEVVPDSEAEQAAAAANSMIGKPRMGITVRSISAYNALISGDIPNGAYVTEVENNSPAAAGGMKAGDIIVECNGTVVSSSSQLTGLIADKNEGDTLQIKVYRAEGMDAYLSGESNKAPEGEYIDLEITLAIVDDVKQ